MFTINFNLADQVIKAAKNGSLISETVIAIGDPDSAGTDILAHAEARVGCRDIDFYAADLLLGEIFRFDDLSEEIEQLEKKAIVYSLVDILSEDDEASDPAASLRRFFAILRNSEFLSDAVDQLGVRSMIDGWL